MTPPRGRAGDNQIALQEAIKRFIVDSGLSPGAALPTEPVLMERLDVSRHPLREAMKALQALGIVEIRHGLGTFVGASSLSFLEAGLAFRTDLSFAGDLRELRNLAQVREVLETGLIHQVVASAAQLDMTALDDAVAAMEAEAEAGRSAPEADWSFHRELYAPLGNELVSELLRVFWSVFHRMDARLPEDDETPATVAARHRAILEAIRGGDAGEAAHAVAAHFRGIDTRISRGMRQRGQSDRN